jgi:hypothetical protein
MDHVVPDLVRPTPILRPGISSVLSKQKAEIYDWIGRLIQTFSSPVLAIDDRYTSILYARFFAGLLSCHWREGGASGGHICINSRHIIRFRSQSKGRTKVWVLGQQPTGVKDTYECLGYGMPHTLHGSNNVIDTATNFQFNASFRKFLPGNTPLDQVSTC